MQKNNKTYLKALFKQLDSFSKLIDKEKAHKNFSYREQIKHITRGLRAMIRENIPVDQLTGYDRWESGMKFRIGNMGCSTSYIARYYWPDSILKALKQNDDGCLKRRDSYFYINNKYYSKGDYFLDKDEKLRSYDKYYKSKDNTAYPKDKYLFATRNSDWYFKKEEKEVYSKTIPSISSVTFSINRWSNATREFVWSMFEYDGKALPDMSRESYGFTFKNINKLKFKPTKEHLAILLRLKGNTQHTVDDVSINMKIYRKEKKHEKAIGFMHKLFYSSRRVELINFQEKLDALGKVADLKEGEDA